MLETDFPPDSLGAQVVEMIKSDQQRYADLVEEYGIDLGDAS